MKKIEQVIIVEGKNDTLRLKRIYDVDTIETDGLALNNLDLIKEIAKSRGIIIFTDPDSPGNKIRHRILNEVPECYQAFIPKEKALGKKKVGVEHAKDEDIIAALENLVTPRNSRDTLSYNEYVRLGLANGTNSQKLRRKVADRLHIGFGTGKTTFKWLNMLGVTSEDIERIINGESE